MKTALKTKDAKDLQIGERFRTPHGSMVHTVIGIEPPTNNSDTTIIITKDFYSFEFVNGWVYIIDSK